jgi:hypothetical protein
MEDDKNDIMHELEEGSMVCTMATDLGIEAQQYVKKKEVGEEYE